MQTIPAYALLAMEPEELAGHMLVALREYGSKPFHRHNVCSEAHWQNAPNGYDGLQDETHQALLEAFLWLQNHGLVIPQPGGDTWSIISRRGLRIEDAGSFRDFIASETFPKALIHPTIREDVWRTFIRGDHATAVFQAMRAVEIAVREAAGFPDKSHGVPMVREAFHKSTGPLTDAATDEGEREALASLFAGTIGSYKNPHSHRNVPLDDPTEAFEMIVLASHLLRITASRLR